MTKPRKKKLIGSTDKIDLPELDLENVACKIDTGAATSTMHCRDLHLLEKDGEEFLCFKLYEPQFHIFTQKEYRFKVFKERKVRSSNGYLDLRYSIKTPVVIMGRKINTEFTLSFRDSMRFPILLGKRFLKNRFIVDVSLDDVNHQQKEKK